MNNPSIKAEKVVTAMLDAAQKGARARTISYLAMVHALQHYEHKVGIPRKALEGSYVVVDIHAHNFPSAYNGRPESTQFKAEFTRGEWRIAWIMRSATERASGEYISSFSETTRAAIVERFARFGG